ncbi:hypothetical protein Lal_00022820 [Lupinus albus]|nr:hypothetical protein Lal_00022820 [Lupinus albus]
MEPNLKSLVLRQVGFTLSDATGNLSDLGTKSRYIWQFNFRDFNLAYNLIWLTFHGSHDFGYLIKIITRCPLPNRLEEFLWFVKVMFGDNVYDVKHMMSFCPSLFGGLDRVARTLNVDREGKSHQASSDSLLTSNIFQKIKET